MRPFFRFIVKLHLPAGVRNYPDSVFSIKSISCLFSVGLGLSVSDTGLLLSSKGGVALAYTALIYPRIGGKFGARTAVIGGLTLWSMVLSAIPMTHLVALNDPSLAWGLLVAIECVTAVIGSTTTIALMMVINNSCDSRVLGQVNGIAQSSMALLRTFGPAAAGSLWTWGVSLELSYGSSLVYWITASLSLFTACFATQLPMSINVPMTGAQKKKSGKPLKAQSNLLHNVADNSASHLNTDDISRGSGVDSRNLL
jgi:hypothetical protein